MDYPTVPVMLLTRFGPTLLKRVLTHDCDAIGLSQGGAFWKGPNLHRQVQNMAAHDMVGSLCIEAFHKTAGIFPPFYRHFKGYWVLDRFPSRSESGK